MPDNANPYGLKPYVPEIKPKAEEAVASVSPAVRREPVSGLRYYDDVVQSANAPESQALGFLARAQAAFSRWYKGEDQLPLQQQTASPRAAAENPTLLRRYNPHENSRQPAPAEAVPDIETMPVQTTRAADQLAQQVVAPPQSETFETHQVAGGDTLGGIAEKQDALREASGLEGVSSVWAVAIATAKLNGMQSVNDTIRAGDTLRLPSADDVRDMITSLGDIAKGGISWSEAKSVDVQHVGVTPAATQVTR